MSEWLGVSGAMAALSQSRAPEAARFLARATAWRRAFAAAEGRRWAIQIASTAEFAAALFGA